MSWAEVLPTALRLLPRHGRDLLAVALLAGMVFFHDQTVDFIGWVVGEIAKVRVERVADIMDMRTPSAPTAAP